MILPNKLLNLMETGIVSETKYGKTRSAQIKTSVFATSSNIKKLSTLVLSQNSIKRFLQVVITHVTN